jgi:hypothetical protein
MVTVTWTIWPEATETGLARVACVSGPNHGSGEVWVTQLAGLLVSRVLGLTVVEKPIFAQVLIAV